MDFLNTSDYYYDLPEELIAQFPLQNRDSSRLLVADRAGGQAPEHKHFYDILQYLDAGDVLVLNRTRVMPARLAAKTVNGGKVELLLLKRLDAVTYEVMVKPGKKAKLGTELLIGEGLSANVLAHTDFGGRQVKFNFTGGNLEAALHKYGTVPLPHYIKAELSDKERYQTVYAKETGSAAAPTAGLHFTDSMLNKIREKGINIATVVLHVGLGTFRPVKSDIITEHKMHSEYFSIDRENADIINRARRAGGSVIAVGTTSVRVLESVAAKDGTLTEASGDTDIFIYPGYNFKCVDKIITNFHLPKSTLLMLVSAFMGRDNALSAYKQAVENKYRFFSFGDAMLIK